MEQQMEVAECRSGTTVFRMIVSDSWERGRVEALVKNRVEGQVFEPRQQLFQ